MKSLQVSARTPRGSRARAAAGFGGGGYPVVRSAPPPGPVVLGAVTTKVLVGLATTRRRACSRSIGRRAVTFTRR
jgi:hypothetical protein